MATTTNYSWATPDDTANVKDGAAAIRSLGTAVDTTVATMVPKSIVDAKGDIIAATAADTVSRLAVGANGTTLVADSAEATGLKWATPAAGGGMTLISTITLSSSGVTISSIPQTYKHLYFVYNAVGSSGSALRLKINGVSNYYNFSTTQIDATSLIDGTSGSSSSDGFVIVQVGSNFYGTTWIPHYTLSTVKHHNTTGARGQRQIISSGFWNDSAAITSLRFEDGYGTVSGTVYMYGVS